MLLSRRLRAVLVLVVVAGALVAGISHKYVWIYLTRKPVLRPLAQDLLSNPKTSNNPEALLAEANRLAWLFNWPKPDLSTLAQRNFSKRSATREMKYMPAWAGFEPSQRPCRGLMFPRCWDSN